MQISLICLLKRLLPIIIIFNSFQAQCVEEEENLKTSLRPVIDILARDLELTQLSSTPCDHNHVHETEADLSFSEGILEFEAYLSQTKINISHERHSPIILHHNKKTEYVVIMIHGLYESPNYLKGILNHFYSKKMNVIAPLMSGHWSKEPGAMEKVKYKDWLNDIKASINIAKKLGKKIILAGFSNGGLLAIRSALDYPEDVSALILWSPAIYLSQKTYWGIQYGKATNKTLNEKLNLSADGYDVADFSPYAGQQVVDLINDSLAKYGENNFETAGMKRSKLAKLINIPTFLTITDEDETAEPKAAKDFFSHIKGPKQLLNFKNGSDIKHGNITKSSSDVFKGWEDRFNFQFPAMMKSIDQFLSEELKD